MFGVLFYAKMHYPLLLFVLVCGQLVVRISLVPKTFSQHQALWLFLCDEVVQQD